MKLSLQLTFISLISIAFASCMQAADNRPVSDETATEISKRVAGFEDAFRKADASWFNDLYSEDPAFTGVLDGELIRGKHPWFDTSYVEPLKQMKELLYYKVIGGKATALAANVGTWSFSFEFGMLMNSGDTVRAKGSAMFVLRKENNDWKVLQVAATHHYY